MTGSRLYINDFLTIIKNGDRYSKNIYSHSILTGNMAYSISLSFMSKPDAEFVRYCGYLHDIGKIAIPLTLLEKPSKLTLKEKKMMDHHVEIGVFILNQYGLNKEAEIIEQHHERVNGTGYPRGIKGNEIFIESKIIGICDAYTALTEHRPYRDKLSPEDAYKIMTLEKEKYDDDVFSTFEMIIRKGNIKFA